MTGLAENWPMLTAMLLAGIALGAFLSHRILRTNNRNQVVRWQRRLREAQQEYDKELTRYGQTLKAAGKKETNLRNALRESEETVRLLSEKNVPAYESEIRQRNERLAELQRKVSHLRAELADAKDQEASDRRALEKLHGELAARDRRMDELLTRNVEYAGLRELSAEQERRYAKVSARLDKEKQRRHDMETAYQERLEQETLALREAQKELDHLRTTARRAELEAPDYLAELAARDARIASLSLEFEEMRHKLPVLNDALREREASIEDLISELSKQRRKNRQLQQQLSEAEPEVPVSAPARRAKVINLQPHLSTDAVARNLTRNHQPDDATRRIAELEEQLDEWKQRSNRACEHPASGLPAAKWQQRRSRQAAPAQQDDLKKIRGIGPVLENALNDLGIVCFDQLAQLNDDDIAALGRHDGSLPKRLQRDGWIEQARSLIRPDA